MNKIERKYLAHFINAAESQQEDAVYERLGTDLEEFSPQMNARVETRRNILGENAVLISGYDKTARVDPYYAVVGSALFERLQSIIDEGKVLDALKTDVVEVKLWNVENDPDFDPAKQSYFPAVRQTVYLEVVSYGGNADGYQIPFIIHYTGQKTVGRFHMGNRRFEED